MRADIHDGPEKMLQSKAGYIDARPLTANPTNLLATHGRTIHSGQSRHFDRAPVTSGLPQKADNFRACRDFAPGPEAVMRALSRRAPKKDVTLPLVRTGVSRKP